MWSLLHNPFAYPSAWTHTSSVVGSCFIYKLGMLTGQRFQAELSPSFLWKFTEFRAETPPHAFGIPNCVTPPTSSEFQSKKPPLFSEFQDAARGMVWIFSGITHYMYMYTIQRYFSISKWQQPEISDFLKIYVVNTECVHVHTVRKSHTGNVLV